jgi:hypothetical protein
LVFIEPKAERFIVVGADWRVGAGAAHCPQPAHSQALADRQPVQPLVSNWTNSYEWCLSKRPIRGGEGLS